MPDPELKTAFISIDTLFAPWLTASSMAAEELTPLHSTEGADSINGRKYEARADIAADDVGGFYRVQVTVAWEQSGKKRQVVFDRLVRNVEARDGNL